MTIPTARARSTERFSIKMSYVLFPVFFLVLVQFFAAALSIFGLPFALLLILSSVISLISAKMMTDSITHVISWKQSLYMLVAASLTTLLFLLRINWHINDYICPTGLLGLVTQVADGTFPVSFLSFPEFPMNYHQGFIFVAGSLSYIFSILPSIAIKITYGILFFLVNITAMLYLLSVRNKYYVLIPLLFVGISSFSTKWFLDISFYNYINIFEQGVSNSWPLSFLLILLFLFMIEHYTASVRKILQVSLLILASATINATVFSILILSILIIFLHQKYYARTFNATYLPTYISAAILIWLIPHFIPSAFLHGIMYDTPQYGIRILETPLFKYCKHMVRYLLLSGPIALLGLWLAYCSLKRKNADVLTVLSAMLCVSFFFPVIFIFKNIDMWDNLHKFATANMFISILLALLFLAKPAFTRKITFALVLCVLLSLPATYDFMRYRLSFDFSNHVYPDEQIADVVSLLQSSDTKVLIPFENDDGGKCEEYGYSAIAQHAGITLRYSYFSNFLLDETFEAETDKAQHWAQDAQLRNEILENLQDDEFLLIKKEYGDEFHTRITTNEHQSKNRSIIEFNNYLLY